MNASADSGAVSVRPEFPPLLSWFLPALIGVLIAMALVVDLLFGRSLAHRWITPFLRDGAPPFFFLTAIAMLCCALFAATVMRRWLPSGYFALIALLFVPTQLVGFSLANIEPLKICLLIVVGFWLTGSLGDHRVVRVYRPVLMLWLLILAFSLVSIVNGRVMSLLSQYSIMAKFVMFFIVANIVRTQAHLVFAVRLLAVLGIASAAAALLQEAIFYFWKVPLSLDDNASRYWFKETPIGWMLRASAFHPTAQNLSHYLVISFALLMVGPFSRALRFGGGLLLVLGVFFTFSGNGLVALAFVLFLVPFLRRPSHTLHYLAILLLLLLLLYQTGLLEFVYQKYLLPISGKSAEDRVEMLQTGLEVVGRHPWFGIGLNNFGRMSPQPVHNAYMQLITEIGVIPGVLLCVILLLVLARLLIGIGCQPDGPVKQSGKGVFLALIGLVFHFMFEPFINSLVSWSIIGLAEATALLLYATPIAGRFCVRHEEASPESGT